MLFKLYKYIRKCVKSARARARIIQYLASGRKPWTKGYDKYKEKFLSNVLNDQNVLDYFSHNRVLPDSYGFRLDERVVEYLWVLSRLGIAERLLLDAGSALNYEYILDKPALRRRSIVAYSLSPENIVSRSNISYIYGDLRRTILKDESFDEIVCISSLEHIGMNNTFLYTKDARLDEFRPYDYQDVVKEFKRLLKPGGKLFITVPYGRYENLGWMQQFDYQRIESILEIFNGSSSNINYFKYFNDGWQMVDADACTNCSYFDIHSSKDYEPDYVAAARAVACIELVK